MQETIRSVHSLRPTSQVVAPYISPGMPVRPCSSGLSKPQTSTLGAYPLFKPAIAMSCSLNGRRTIKTEEREHRCRIRERSSVLMGRLHNGAIATTASLDVVAVDAGGGTRGEATLPCLLATVVVDVLDVEGVKMTRDVPQQRQTNVDKQVSATARHHPNAQRREEYGNEDQEDGRNGAHRVVSSCSRLGAEFCLTRYLCCFNIVND